jgi:hypothetical protein
MLWSSGCIERGAYFRNAPLLEALALPYLKMYEILHQKETLRFTAE